MRRIHNNQREVDVSNDSAKFGYLIVGCVSILAAMCGSASGAVTEGNPFAPFFGEWTLKQDKFQQVWDGKTVENLVIPGHYTKCAPINTDRSVLCVVDAGDLKGHIFWSYDGDQKQVHHLSHFGTARNGVGVGTLNEKGDLRSKVSFQGEPEGSYRIYEYTWVSRDEYTMMSRQFTREDKPTGNWYGGTFVRLPPASRQ
jgi:hypothetical protein